ncbi:MAG: hypothetical protein KGL92_15580 [Gammaproteobacteria bacterium]|nr:hypothetical protein [Gammaproteobacteria bacterium]
MRRGIAFALTWVVVVPRMVAVRSLFRAYLDPFALLVDLLSGYHAHRRRLRRRGFEPIRYPWDFD